MKAKEFFKSNAFKCVAVLMLITLIAGALLAIFNDLLYVSPAERRNRVFKKLYGGDVTEQQVLLGDDSDGLSYGNGTVTQAYLMSDGTYAIQAIGKGGYAGGSITVWVILTCTGSQENGNLKLTGIEKVVYESSEKQSYIGRFSDADYKQFTNYNEQVASGSLFGEDINVVKTGPSAPLTFGALKNAVNAALGYFRAEVIKEPESPYAYKDYINLAKSSATAEENLVIYHLVTTTNTAQAFTIEITVTDGAITDYEIATNGSTKPSYIEKMPEGIKNGTFFIGKEKAQIEALLTDGGALSEGSGLLSTGATRSLETCVRAAAFAVSNYELILAEGGFGNE